MGFLLLLLIFGIMFVMVSNAKRAHEITNSDNKVIIKKEKKCPPHKWGWQEMVDQDGNKLGERIVCAHCGPLKGSNEN